jgi:hypothetical protein
MRVRIIITCVLSAAILFGAIPGARAGALLSAQDVCAIVGGCAPQDCGFWGPCYFKHCYAPGLCVNCTAWEDEFYCTAQLFPDLFPDSRCHTVVEDERCEYQAPYGECDYWASRGLCVGGYPNLILCAGKNCIKDN